MSAHYQIRYLTARHRPKRGRDVYFWQPGPPLPKLGWKTTALKDSAGEYSNFTAAVAQAIWLNRILDAWRGENAELLQALLKAWATDNPQSLGEDGVGLGHCPYIPYSVPGIERAKLPADPNARTLNMLRNLFFESVEFRELAPKTQIDYRSKLNKVCDWCGDAPVRQVTRPLAKAYHKAVYEEISLSSANARIRVLRLLMSFAVDAGWLQINPLLNLKLKGTAPRVRILSKVEIHALIKAADQFGQVDGEIGASSIGDAVMLAHDLGQRRSDTLAITQVQFAKGAIALQQKKTKVIVAPPVTPRLRARLEEADIRNHALHGDLKARLAADRLRNPDRYTRNAPLEPTLIVSEATGLPYYADSFTKRFADVRARAARECPSVADALFMDLRDTAVTRLAEAGCTIPEICSITGHTLESATRILKHYLSLTQELANSAIAKLVTSIEGNK